MSTMTPLPKDHPIIVAWENYKQTGDYLTTRQWATVKEYTDGSLWAAFLEGWQRHESFLQSQNDRLVRALEEWTDEYLRMMREVREIGYSEFNCKADMASRSLTLLTEIKKGQG